jgi:predicted O-methyltransferase YrrM
MPDFPVVIVSYSRPDYLDAVLRSLRDQKDVDLQGRPIALFQDGWIDAAGRNTIDPAVPARCVDIFRALFPQGQVFGGEANLGTALNIDRAERFVFESCNAPAGIFLEDDMVLGHAYLAVLETLIGHALEDERIGYVAAFGNFQAPLAKQLLNPRRLRALHLLWAFGLTKRHWLKCRPYVEQYLNIVRGVPYRRRDHDQIRALTASWGIEPGDTAQDRIKCFATALVGAVKLNTEVCYAKYIGVEGENFNRAMYERWRLDKSEFSNVPVATDFEFERVDYDPWGADHAVWKLGMGQDSKPVPAFDRLTSELFDGSPYKGFKPIFDQPTFTQNWNSTHPLLTRLVAETKAKIIVDVGVWQGLSTATLAAAQQTVAPDGIVIAVDTFLGSPEHWTKARLDVHAALRFRFGMPNLYETFLSNMVTGGHSGRVVPIAQTSRNAARILQRLQIRPDLVHIDAAHDHDDVLRDIEMYYDLLTPNGMLIGDDFNWPGVARAVVHFTDAQGLEFSVEHPKWYISRK